MSEHDDLDVLMQIVRHQQRNRFARFIACGGVVGFIQWSIVCAAILFFAAIMCITGNWAVTIPAILGPALLMFLLRGALVALWPGTRHVLNIIALLLVLSVVFRSQHPALATDTADLIRIAFLSAHASAYFWTLSDTGLVPKKI